MLYHWTNNKCTENYANHAIRWVREASKLKFVQIKSFLYVYIHLCERLVFMAFSVSANLNRTEKKCSEKESERWKKRFIIHDIHCKTCNIRLDLNVE